MLPIVIGIRMALGAIVLRGVFGHGMRLTLMGLAAGLTAALMLTRLLDTLLLRGSAPNDPETVVGGAGLIAAVAAAASLVPALRPTPVDPIVALIDR